MHIIYIYIYIYIYIHPLRGQCALGGARCAYRPGPPNEARRRMLRGGPGRVSTEVAFGRGDLSVCPLGQGPGSILFLIGGVSPRGPHRETLRALLHRGTSVLH